MDENIICINHPLITHKITLLRDKNTPTAEFRKIVKEIAMLEGYVALQDATTKMIEI